MASRGHWLHLRNFMLLASTLVVSSFCQLAGTASDELSFLATSVVVRTAYATESIGPEVAGTFIEESSHSASARWTFYEYALIPLLTITALAAWMTRPKLDPTDKITPEFSNYRFTFLLVWSVGVLADWLQGPYVYALYDSYGYNKSDINKLFVVGFASSMIFGTFVGSLADTWGRKRTTLLYCILYVLSCLTKHCSSYGVLMIGRILGGIATSLLFSSFECWMVSEHNQRHRFSAGLLRYMFSMMYFVNYLVAIFAGLIAQAFVDAIPMRKIPGSSVYYGGNLCPFDLATIALCMLFPVICISWDENYGDPDSKQTLIDSFGEALKALTSSWKIACIGIVVGCFEGSMYCFVINWTPSLDMPGAPSPPHGVIFSAMMMCCMVGSSAFSFFNPRINLAMVLAFACSVSAAVLLFVSLTTGRPQYVGAIYSCFLVFELCVGVYMPALGALKSELVPEEARAGVYNWYRVPLNIVVCTIILADMQLNAAFGVCAGLLTLAAALMIVMTAFPPAAKPLKLGSKE